MTGSASDELDWQQHIRNKPRREALARRFKDPDDEFKLVIVRDMWLTGFDAPSLTTMYVDKPMRGHGLMQAIARVNRVFRDKQGGVVVDYLGIAYQLKQALHDYTDGGGKGEPVIDQAQAVAVMLEKFEVVRDMLHGFEFAAVWARGTHEEKLQLIGDGKEFVLGLEDGKRRFVEAVTALGKAFSLAVPHPDAIAHPRRGRPTSRRCARPLMKTDPAAGLERRGARPGRAADRLAGGLDRRGRRRLRRGRPRAPRHLGARRPLPRRGARHAAPQPGRRAAAEAAARRGQGALPPQSRRVAALLGDAAERRDPVPEPGDHLRPGHRGAHQAGQGAPRGARTAASSSA